MQRSIRTFAASIAMLAMALQALWPLIAQAKPVSAGLRLPVCTIDGVTHYIELARADTPLERRSASNHQHCPLCVAGSERVAVLPAVPVPVLTIPPVPAVGSATQAVAAPEAPSHSPAQPRAPPELSSQT